MRTGKVKCGVCDNYQTRFGTVFLPVCRVCGNKTDWILRPNLPVMCTRHVDQCMIRGTDNVSHCPICFRMGGGVFSWSRCSIHDEKLVSDGGYMVCGTCVINASVSFGKGGY